MNWYYFYDVLIWIVFVLVKNFYNYVNMKVFVELLIGLMCFGNGSYSSIIEC